MECKEVMPWMVQPRKGVEKHPSKTVSVERGAVAWRDENAILPTRTDDE